MFADRILQLSPEGTITRTIHVPTYRNLPKLQTTSTSTSNEQSSNLPLSSNGQGSSLEDQMTASAAEESNSVPIGDGRVYLYYLASFGVAPIAIWTVLTAAGELLFKMPSKYYAGQLVSLLTTKDILLRLWFENDPSDKQFLYGYTSFAVGSTLFCAATIWYVYVTHI